VAERWQKIWLNACLPLAAVAAVVGAWWSFSAIVWIIVGVLLSIIITSIEASLGNSRETGHLVQFGGYPTDNRFASVVAVGIQHDFWRLT
jgi:hypothetical protein